MNRFKYAIRHISVRSALLYGFILGCVLSVLPGLFLGIVLHELVAALVDALSTGLFVPDLGPLTNLRAMGWTLPWRTMFLLTITSGIFSAFSCALGALIYNLVASIGGGLTVTTELLDLPSATAIAAAPTVGNAPTITATPTGTTQAATLPAKALVQSAGVGPQSTGRSMHSPSTGTDRPEFWLMLRKQPERRWPVQRALTTLGSTPSCDVCLPGLASRHAEIRVDGGRYILFDLSGGDCWVNGRQITTANMLKEGFVIRFGEDELIFGS